MTTWLMLASFTMPMRIDTVPGAMLWLLPLVVSIAVVYKATKVGSVRPWPFVKESAVLVGSIMIFIVVAALVLYVVSWFVTQQLPATLDISTF
jgi:uncharacterized membrane protein YwzB